MTYRGREGGERESDLFSRGRWRHTPTVGRVVPRAHFVKCRLYFGVDSRDKSRGRLINTNAPTYSRQTENNTPGLSGRSFRPAR